MNPATFLGRELASAVFGIPAVTFWPYFAGAAALVIGLARFPRKEFARERGLDKLIWIGPLLLAFAIAVFGADHFMTAKFVAMVVPKWMPWRLFWAYFVGAALMAAALSFTTKVGWRAAGAMFGLMLFLFVVLMDIENLVRVPKDFVVTLVARDMAIGAGPLAFGMAGGAVEGLRARVIAAARIWMAIPIAAFGVLQFRHPAFAPGIPSDDPTMLIHLPNWLPAHAAWAYLSGAIFICCAVGLVTKKYARVSAVALGVLLLAVIVVVYIPLTITNRADVNTGLNYLAIHCSLAGSVLMMAAAVESGDA